MIVEDPDPGAGLAESRLYTFLDGPGQFALYFLEGQRLIRDLALIGTTRGDSFARLRDVVLSVQPMVAFTKRGEQFGFYLDSDDPVFHLKLEAGHHGEMRCAMVPEAASGLVADFSGTARLLKIFSDNRPPYQSILRIDRLPLPAIVNRVLQTSHQVHATVVVSSASDQSVLLHQMPPIKGKENWECSDVAVEERRRALGNGLEGIFARALSDGDEIRDALGAIGFRYLADRPIRLRCSCSRDRMVTAIRSLANVRVEELFDPDQSFLEVVCEYCRTRHMIGRDEIRSGVDPVN